jgi:hypothetical protein
MQKVANKIRTNQKGLALAAASGIMFVLALALLFIVDRATYWGITATSWMCTGFAVAAGVLGFVFLGVTLLSFRRCH